MNINSIPNNLDLLHTELHDNDIICVSEPKLNSLVRTIDLVIDGFNIPIRKDRCTNNGGGLMIYMKCNIQFIRRQELENGEIVNIWIERSSLNKKFHFGLFYRPPNSLSEYWDSFESIPDMALDLNLDTLIMGDFNHDRLKLNNNSKLLRIMTKYNLQNMKYEPTRITSTSQVCIDLILTNHKLIIINIEV